MGRTNLLVAAAAVLVMAWCGAGCESKSRRAAGYYAQAQAARGATAASMAADWRAKKILLDDCLNIAFERLDSDGDVASMIFAGTVLDFAQLIETDLPRSGEMELLYVRLGGLAAASGQKAFEAGDMRLARSLVLAGPARWQNEMYWMRHPNHDALASYVLYYAGEGGEAVRRLRSRPELGDAQQQALQDIEARLRQAPQ